ncbi:hypothetical protein N7489_007911 [Penicillium chrysogenum]|jgi:hypothetical protein|uniref:uncharacterized protein n=1 Tax=Penicillium chrysogenum TaxID=5076 RepID=UPI0023A36D7A|nr:uncharacterized protein N7489_007911 [Penicillium chrysogenum]KAJ5237820.1 hypothetical protein N7489_007911 [Penicillium chrysogenum]KAJ5278121.1 hypothetical protein N7524_004274 [Penicillium chrysogenum]
MYDEYYALGQRVFRPPWQLLKPSENHPRYPADDDESYYGTLSIPHEPSACVRAIVACEVGWPRMETGLVPEPFKSQDDCMTDTPMGSVAA